MASKRSVYLKHAHTHMHTYTLTHTHTPDGERSKERGDAGTIMNIH